jgi:hypothetical protein
VVWNLKLLESAWILWFGGWYGTIIGLEIGTSGAMLIIKDVGAGLELGQLEYAWLWGGPEAWAHWTSLML